MKIEQFITSPSINFFEYGFQKKWNLSKYFDDTKPLFFFGLRGLENFFESHKGYKIVLPCTSNDLPNFGILIPNSRSLVSLRSEDTLISKKRLMVDRLKLDLKLYTSFLGR